MIEITMTVCWRLRSSLLALTYVQTVCIVRCQLVSHQVTLCSKHTLLRCVCEPGVQSPDGKYIACGAIDGIIYIFEVVSEKLIHTLEGECYLI